MRRTKRVNAGGWRTLEWFFGGTGTAFFDAPAGALRRIGATPALHAAAITVTDYGITVTGSLVTAP